MKYTNDHFWLFISITLSVIVMSTAWVYAFRPFDAASASPSNQVAPVLSQPQLPSSGQSVGCGA